MDKVYFFGFLWGAIVALSCVALFRKVDGEKREEAVRPSDGDFLPWFGDPVCSWYRAYAWRPVRTLDRGYIWLRPYWRRGIQRKLFLHGRADIWWQKVVYY